MKRVGKFSIILFVLTVFLTVPVQSQNEPGMGMPDPGVIPKPAFETTESGLHLQVWIMSVVDDIPGLKANENERDMAETDENFHGTHHVMVEVKDAVEGKEITNADLKLEILSPTGKTDVVDLETMMNQYGGNIPLKENGEYRLNLTVSTADGRTVRTPFSYKVSR